jgi:hypothetical protein
MIISLVTVADYCDSCTGDADYDVFCEDAEDVGTPNGDTGECTWTDTEAGVGGDVDWDATHVGWGCANTRGSNALEIDVVAGSENYTEIDLGGDQTPFYFAFYGTYPDVTNNGDATWEATNEIPLLTIENTTGFARFYLRARNVGGTLRLIISYHNGPWQAITADSAYSEGDIYLYELYRSGTNVQIWIDDVSEVNVSDLSGNIQYINLGNTFTTDETVTGIQFDIIGADDDTMPPGCT